MLIKLLKYELKATGRIMLSVYALLIVASVGLAVNLRYSSDGEFQQLLTLLLLILFAISLIAVFVSTAILIIGRFYKNLLRNEGYLMFSLPVSTWQLILSKLLCPLIWMICSLAVGLLCGFIIERVLGDGMIFYDQVHALWVLLMGNYGTAGTIGLLSLTALAVILSILESIFKVYACMSVGQLWGNHRVLGSILTYIGFSIIESVASSVLNLERFFIKVNEPPAASASQIEIMNSWTKQISPYSVWMIVISAAGILIYGVITWQILDRRLNLE